MAEFCRQCKREDFGIDDHDYSPDIIELGDDLGYPVICEGCGFVYVDKDGNCIATRDQGCLRGHGDGRQGK